MGKLVRSFCAKHVSNVQTSEPFEIGSGWEKKFYLCYSILPFAVKRKKNSIWRNIKMLLASTADVYKCINTKDKFLDEQTKTSFTKVSNFAQTKMKTWRCKNAHKMAWKGNKSMSLLCLFSLSLLLFTLRYSNVFLISKWTKRTGVANIWN